MVDPIGYLPDKFLNPFGNPEGARADIDEVTRGFVEFGNALQWRGLASQPSDYSARILVGQKGSGKTVYLRRAHEYAVSDKNVVACQMDQGPPPSTEDVKRFSQMFAKYDLREHWASLWQRAILRSVASHLCNNDQLDSYFAKGKREEFLKDFREVIRPEMPYRTPVGIYNEVQAILRIGGTHNAYHGYLFDGKWGQCEAAIAELLRWCPPLCFYIDGVDDYFQHAPMYWLECQIGMYSAIMDLLRDRRFGARLHIFATLRDLVLVKIQQGEHALRNYEEPHVRILRWNTKSLQYLLDQKLARLDKVFFQSPGRQLDLQSWLGSDRFENNSRRIEEPMIQYLLRHTRLVPRDLVTLGNLLCQELARLRWYPESYTREEAIARAVRFAAKKLGTEELAICAHQIATDLEPSGDTRRSSGFQGADEYRQGLSDALREFIREFRVDRFSQAVLVRQDQAAARKFGGGVDVLSVLWLNGLLGYVDAKDGNGLVRFYSTDHAADFKLPRDKKAYAFHSALIDVTGIKAYGKPVVHCE